MSDIRDSRAAPGARRRWRYVILVCAAIPLIAIAGFVAAARSDPDLIGRTVDAVRNVVGPAPVAAIEDVFYQGVDTYNRARFRLTGEADGWQLAQDGPAPAATRPPGAPILPAVVTGRSAAARASGSAAPAASTPGPAGSQASLEAKLSVPAADPAPASPPQPLAPSPEPAAGGSQAAPDSQRVAFGMEPTRAITPLLSSPVEPGEGVWQPLEAPNQPASDAPVMWQTVYRPDPTRPFARVVLVAVDLTQSRLHIVPGTSEPASQVPAKGLRSGMIPEDVLASGNLLAAWNGGFKATHGHYGMMTNGVVWLPPQEGMATIAVKRDGSATLGAWGRGVKPDEDWLAWRQNNPPLIENGVVNPDVAKYANTIRWGASVDGAVVIWRSGMGMTQDRRWLIYAAGNSLSVASLAEALRAAGAWDAMQLDVNATWERFVTFSATPQTVQRNGTNIELPLTAHRLITQMSAGPAQFLVPYDRDFFYLTAK